VGWVDCQLACVVTDWFVPFDIEAVAVNCEDAPIVGVDPATETVVTVGVGARRGFEVGVVLPPPQEDAPIAVTSGRRHSASSHAISSSGVCRRCRDRSAARPLSMTSGCDSGGDGGSCRDGISPPFSSRRR
jgi:hypothetical protein